MATPGVETRAVGGEIYAAAEESLSRAPHREIISFTAHGMGLITHEAPRLTGEGPVPYPADDAVYPGGHKNSREDIVRFMQRRVMPWARQAFAPIAGSSDRVTCNTCHGAHPEHVDWRMPAVAALPRPAVKEAGWEIWGGPMDAQMRNAIYGYVAESDKLSKAAYMRTVVMPGMAAVMHQPAYDFTKSYGYNRAHVAVGCYHCHLVESR